MMQSTLTTKKVAAIGEEIGLELGTQMVKAYQESNPTEVKAFLIGRKIIEQILSQPDCAGVKFYNAVDESGSKTLVYVAVNEQGEVIREYTYVSSNGNFEKRNAIVADRVKPDRHGEDWWAVD